MLRPEKLSMSGSAPAAHPPSTTRYFLVAVLSTSHLGWLQLLMTPTQWAGIEQFYQQHCGAAAMSPQGMRQPVAAAREGQDTLPRELVESSLTDLVSAALVAMRVLRLPTRTTAAA